LIATSEIKPSHVLLTSLLNSLLEKEKMYLIRLRKIKASYLRRVLPTPTTVSPIKKSAGNYNHHIHIETDRILKELDKIYDKMEPIDPEYVFLRKGRILPLDRLQNIISHKAKAVLLEYFMAQDKIFIFAISSHEFHVKTIELSQEKLASYIENYWREVIKFSSFGDIGNTWLELSNYLIEPISEYLSEADVIHFVPYGSYTCLNLCRCGFGYS
jgi:hypothetical protein